MQRTQRKLSIRISRFDSNFHWFSASISHSVMLYSLQPSSINGLYNTKRIIQIESEFSEISAFLIVGKGECILRQTDFSFTLRHHGRCSRIVLPLPSTSHPANTVKKTEKNKNCHQNRCLNLEKNTKRKIFNVGRYLHEWQLYDFIIIMVYIYNSYKIFHSVKIGKVNGKVRNNIIDKLSCAVKLRK